MARAADAEAGPSAKEGGRGEGGGEGGEEERKAPLKGDLIVIASLIDKMPCEPGPAARHPRRPLARKGRKRKAKD
eukprot:3167766-Rhodomonas_salina.1